MKIVLYTTNAKAHATAENAFLLGLSKHELIPTVRSIKQPPIDCDLAVFWGFKDRTLPFQKHQKKNKKDFLVMERGFIGGRHNFFSFGFNGLNGRADFVNKNSPPDRWNKHFDNKNIFKEWRMDGKYILITGQVPGDASMKHLPGGIVNYNKLVNDLKKITTLPIKFRPHPKTLVERWKSRYKNVAPKGVEVTQSTSSNLYDDLKDAKCVITFNSNTCVDATLYGVYCVVLDEGAMAWEMCGHKLEDVNTTMRYHREQWAYNLAYTQWTIEEIKQGMAWESLKRKYQ